MKIQQNLNLKEEQQPGGRAVTGLLNQLLADVICLQLSAKQAHWNVTGPNFIALHQLFDTVEDAVGSYADLIAERVVQLGIAAQGGPQDIARAAANRASYPAGLLDGEAQVDALGGMLRAVADRLRGAIDTCEDEGDAVTVDILTESTRGLDKLRWMVESHKS